MYPSCKRYSKPDRMLGDVPVPIQNDRKTKQSVHESRAKRGCRRTELNGCRTHLVRISMDASQFDSKASMKARSTVLIVKKRRNSTFCSLGRGQKLGFIEMGKPE